tara:strand:+ start:346 stop:462 length:117 start_codon:yes stop_codon:yes gene_type:complete
MPLNFSFDDEVPDVKVFDPGCPPGWKLNAFDVSANAAA